MKTQTHRAGLTAPHREAWNSETSVHQAPGVMGWPPRSNQAVPIPEPMSVLGAPLPHPEKVSTVMFLGPCCKSLMP